ncbi:Septum formation [Corynebacterium mustelae]|uniref:Septum formation n=1 Tax=Corynebacterium mustelae TaxID=571915 RepID=A0A0G3H1A9_9CORY|nr:septum formation family protein [Corynebacterium mustelae]AKK07174.1 Septum formation [Corynebacterium mustelae]
MDKKWRSAEALRIALVAALATVAAIGGYKLVSSSTPQPVAPVQSEASQSDNATNSISFTSADVGSCLTWKLDGGAIASFEQTDCAGPHRFEVASREDLAVYPSSEFGETAKLPNQTRQAQLREELCLDVTMEYLGGSFDPLGRYSVASILPPQESWNAGDRTLLCGVQATDSSGTVITTTGKAAQQDQSRVFAVGSCVAVDSASATKAVDCSEPHQLETTAIVDLKTVFPDGTPSIEDQDSHLRKACTQAGREYLGGEEQLYRSTLQPLWTSLPANSWNRGSHSVNCSLMFADGENLGTLVGSAKETFTINGNPPENRPERSPIVNPEALDKVEH